MSPSDELVIIFHIKLVKILTGRVDDTAFRPPRTIAVQFEKKLKLFPLNMPLNELEDTLSIIVPNNYFEVVDQTKHAFEQSNEYLTQL